MALRRARQYAQYRTVRLIGGIEGLSGGYDFGACADGHTSTGGAMHTLNVRKCARIRARRQVTRTAFTACSIAFCLFAAAPATAQAISDDWQFALALYGWLPDIGGHTSFPTSDGGTIDIGVDKILDNLDMGGLASFSLQKGHWGAYTDIIYLDLGASKSQTRDLTPGGVPLPASVTAGLDLDFKSTIWTIGASYRLMGSEASVVDVLAGARYASFKPKLKWDFSGSFGSIAPPPRTGSSEVTSDQWDAIVGVKGHVAFGADRKWVMPYYFDVGAGDSDLTWQAELGLGYAFGWGDLQVAWRYLDYDLKPGKPVADFNFSGPGFGVEFRW